MDRPSNGKEERKIIDGYMDEWSLESGGKPAFILTMDWYKTWVDYTEDKSPSPTPIQNSKIIREPTSKEIVIDKKVLLKKGLQEREDFIIIPKKVWDCFAAWYGCDTTIQREVIEEGEKKDKRVEVYLLPIRVSLSTKKGEIDTSNILTIYESKSCTLEKFHKDAASIFNVSFEETRIWNAFSASFEPLWNRLENTMADVDIIPSQIILLEQKINGEWKRKTPSNSMHKRIFGKAKSYFDYVYDFLLAPTLPVSSITTPPISGSRANTIKGLCGLSNLGNTCFMNSALQCLSNAQPITDYFLSSKYKRELNRDNPLGMRGALAEHYAITLEHMWSGDYRYVAPRNLKSTIGKFAPRFSGYSQQDSQEFLGFLLDGLHEDLNRVKKKPYVVVPDEDGDRPDDIIASEAWERHLQRNQSIIVDQCQAQLKSTLVCPKCSFVSIIFDPFMYLSVTFPSKYIYKKVASKSTTTTKNGTYIPTSTYTQMRSDITVPLEACLESFSEAETLGENDMWYCPKCKEHVQAQKKMDLWSSPDILIIHLKRFSQRTRAKITSPICYPVKDLDLSNVLLDKSSKLSPFYDLFAVSHHSGSMRGGHYTAIAKNKNGKWYNFDDTNVRPVDVPQTTMKSTSAYLLFYQRKPGPSLASLNIKNERLSLTPIDTLINGKKSTIELKKEEDEEEQINKEEEVKKEEIKKEEVKKEEEESDDSIIENERHFESWEDVDD